MNGWVDNRAQNEGLIRDTGSCDVHAVAAAHGGKQLNK